MKMINKYFRFLVLPALIVSSSYGAETVTNASTPFPENIHAVYYSCMKLMEKEECIVHDITNSDKHLELQTFEQKLKELQFDIQQEKEAIEQAKANYKDPEDIREMREKIERYRSDCQEGKLMPNTLIFVKDTVYGDWCREQLYKLSNEVNCHDNNVKFERKRKLKLLERELSVVESDIQNLKGMFEQNTRYYSINGEAVKYSDVERLKLSAQKLLNLICHKSKAFNSTKYNVDTEEKEYNPNDAYNEAMRLFMLGTHSVKIDVITFLMEKYKDGLEENRRRIWQR